MSNPDDLKKKMLDELMPPLFNEQPQSTLSLLALSKIGSLEHLQQIQKGRVRFKPLSYYKDQENETYPWADKNESIAAIYPPENIKMVIDLKDNKKLILDKSNGLDLILVLANRVRSWISLSVLCSSAN